MATNNNNSPTTESLASGLQALEKFMGTDLRDKVELLLMRGAKKVLHKELHVEKHSEDDVRAVIDAFPAALSAFGEGGAVVGRLPIQNILMSRKSLPFIPCSLRKPIG